MSLLCEHVRLHIEPDRPHLKAPRKFGSCESAFAEFGRARYSMLEIALNPNADGSIILRGRILVIILPPLYTS